MKSVFVVVAVFLMLGGCATTGNVDQNICRSASAKHLIGLPALKDAELQRRTKSAIIRRLAPGDMATWDFRIERLTVTIDGGKIVAASCG